MNYLINFLLVIFIFTSKSVFSSENNENIIIFEINEKIYTTIDYNNRLEYLKILNGKNIKELSKNEIIQDYYKSIIFFEYIKNKASLKDILDREVNAFFEKIKSNKTKDLEALENKTLIDNIKYDLSRKIIIENNLDNYKEYIFNNPKDISFIYNHQLNYITVAKDDIVKEREFENILYQNNFGSIIRYLKQNGTIFLNEKIKIKDLNKVNLKIKKLINSKKDIIIEKDKYYYRIINYKKELDIKDGVFYRLINIEVEKKLEKKQEDCSYISNINNIKSSKEYEYNKLNEKIKNSLISINDFIIFQNDVSYNYIFLCEIKINDKFLKEININKKIGILAKNIEDDFINKYSKIFNTKKYYE